MNYIRIFIIVLVAGIACLAAAANSDVPPIFDSVDKPTWWDEFGQEFSPFESRDEIIRLRRKEDTDDRIYIKRALLTAEFTPENKDLVSFSLFYIPYGEFLSGDTSIQIFEYFLRHYFYRKEENYCFRCSKDGGMVAGVVERLVSQYCRAGRDSDALSLIDKFISERKLELDITSQSKIYARLTECRRRSDLRLTDNVYEALEKVHKELWPLADLYNANSVYQVGRAVMRERTARGVSGHCELKRLEAAHYKRTDRVKSSISWMAEKLESSNWGAHMFGFSNFLLSESDSAVKLAKEIFLNGYYEDKFPSWKEYYAYSEAIFGMACLDNRVYQEILISHFYNDRLLLKNEQIELAMDRLYPAVKGYKRTIVITNLGGELEVSVGHYRGLLDAHGETIVFKKIRIKGKVYWLPIYNSGHWFA
ncbi:hypothetical protein [Gilvimarinus polysaccharolyticus]|uniref:hypothetical protein n=1 Tax=Gilvimarinus polysaccharolyticus TaxID=863921 RepID=UPI0006734B33|nr:hypothetical protein [Gilvimarinus polysaccharolyticus]